MQTNSTPDLPKRRLQRCVHSRPVLLCLPILVLCALPPLAGCGDPDPETEGVITREEFVQAYAELRVSALRTEDGKIVPEERDRILADLGLTQDDLLGFVEAYGRDVDFMYQVWEEVDANLETRRNAVSDSFVT